VLVEVKLNKKAKVRGNGDRGHEKWEKETNSDVYLTECRRLQTRFL